MIEGVAPKDVRSANIPCKVVVLLSTFLFSITEDDLESFFVQTESNAKCNRCKETKLFAPAEVKTGQLKC